MGRGGKKGVSLPKRLTGPRADSPYIRKERTEANQGELKKRGGSHYLKAPLGKK